MITPWNFPLLMPAMDVIPALLTGAAVILKPSEVTPLSALELARGWREIGAPPVLACVTGRGDTGAAVVDVVDVVDMVQFTGSTVRVANDLVYGLSATVWTGSRSRGDAIARRLEAGAVNVNDMFSNLFCFGLPHGGWKSSGIGARLGPAQILPGAGRHRTPVPHTDERTALVPVHALAGAGRGPPAAGDRRPRRSSPILRKPSVTLGGQTRSRLRREPIEAKYAAEIERLYG